MAVVLAAASLTAGATAGAAPAALLSSPSDTGASDISNLGGSGWSVLSSANTTATGAQISTPGFSTTGWLPVSNDDAGAPGTEIEALAQNRQCPMDTALQPVNQSLSSPSSVFFSNNIQLCYGFMSKVGSVTTSLFDVPWWWRTDFTATVPSGGVANLIVNGVIGSANVWVNGTEVATSATVTGAYTKFSFNITGLVHSGMPNSLAIEINPNDPTTMFTVDNVDWTQIPPDNNTGVQFPVQLQLDGALSIGNSHVNQSDTLPSSAQLTVKTDVTNNATTAQTATVNATITPPTGTAITLPTQSVSVPASSTVTVTFAEQTISRLHVRWTHRLPAQPPHSRGDSFTGRNPTTQQ